MLRRAAGTKSEAIASVGGADRQSRRKRRRAASRNGQRAGHGPQEAPGERRVGAPGG